MDELRHCVLSLCVRGGVCGMAVSQEVFRDHFFPGDHQTLFPIGKSGPQAAGRAEGFSLLALKYPSLRRKDFTYLLLLLGQQT